MGVTGTLYPLSSSVTTALGNYQEISTRLQLDNGSSHSKLEIVRLLDNTHYDHITRLLEFINGNIAVSGSIGERLVGQSDPFQFKQALVELFIFVHLYERMGQSIHACQGRSDQRSPDIEINWDSVSVCVEVYSPIDFIGFQLVKQHVRSILKYLDVNSGYRIEVAVEPTSGTDVTYPFEVGSEEEVTDWLTGFAQNARDWLTGVIQDTQVSIEGLNGRWRVTIHLQQSCEDRSIRQITLSPGTYSTDTRLFFECGTVEDTANSQWGRKLKGKLGRRQCGRPSAGRLRFLVVDFSQADTGWPDFICWPEIVERMQRTVQVLANELGEPCPYELVLPAQLSMNCCFGPPIILVSEQGSQIEAFMEATSLNRPCA